MELKIFSEYWIPRLVDYWNDYFKEYSNFFPLNNELFTNKVIKNELFDSKGLILAVKNDRIIGFVHASKKGSEGSIYMLHVNRDNRRRGVGSELLNKAEEYLKGVSKINFLSSGIFYGNNNSPETSLISNVRLQAIPITDQITNEFLNKRGYESDKKLVSMKLKLNNLRISKEKNDFYKRLEKENKLSIRILRNEIPSKKTSFNSEFSTIVLSAGGKDVGHVIWHDLKELNNYKRTSMAGIYDINIDKGSDDLKDYLIVRALQAVKSQGFSEVETVPELNDKELISYLQNSGFKRESLWVGFKKSI